MHEAKLTVRVSRELLENVKRYAAENNTTLTDLSEAYLRCIPASQSMENAPIVRRLSGTLVMDVSPRDHKKHLEKNMPARWNNARCTKCGFLLFSPGSVL